MAFDYATFTVIGQRAVNQDSLLVWEGPEFKMLLAADGLGGYTGGELASQAAVEFLQDQLHGPLPYKSGLEAVLMGADRHILQLQKKTGLYMMTTLAVVLMNAYRIILGHIGDTRIYGFKDDELVYLSVDDSMAQMAVASGMYPKELIRQHPQRHILTKALGTGEKQDFHIKEFKIDELDAVLLCTDGIWELLPDEVIGRYLHSSETCEEWLDKIAGYIETHSGFNDNASMAAARWK